LTEFRQIYTSDVLWETHEGQIFGSKGQSLKSRWNKVLLQNAPFCQYLQKVSYGFSTNFWRLCIVVQRQTCEFRGFKRSKVKVTFKYKVMQKSTFSAENALLSNI